MEIRINGHDKSLRALYALMISSKTKEPIYCIDESVILRLKSLAKKHNVDIPCPEVRKKNEITHIYFDELSGF